MKKLIFLAAITLTVQSFAAGVVGNDQPQAGSIALTNGSPLGRFTNSFPYSFSRAPVMRLTGSAGPYTLNSVTESNYDVSVTSTNDTVLSYQAYLGYPRIQAGQVLTAANTTTNVVFPVPYAFPPRVTLGQGGTNASYQAAVRSVSATGFSLLSNLASTNQWTAIGDAYAPGKSTVTY